MTENNYQEQFLRSSRGDSLTRKLAVGTLIGATIISSAAMLASYTATPEVSHAIKHLALIPYASLGAIVTTASLLSSNAHRRA